MMSSLSFALAKHLEEYRAASQKGPNAKPPSLSKVGLCGCDFHYSIIHRVHDARQSGVKNKIHPKLKRWIRDGRPVPKSVVDNAWQTLDSLQSFAKHFSIRTHFAARVLDTYGHGFSQIIANRYRAGVVLPQLSDEQGVSQKLLVKIIEESGVKVTKGRRRPIYDKIEIANRYAEVKSVRRIQMEFGMSWATADKILRELEVR